MQTRTIESFLELFREGNMTRAAAALDITQQGLSRQIGALERELDVVLFERTRSGVEPTETCRRLQPHLARMAEECAIAARIAEDSRQSEGARGLTMAFAMGLSNCLDTEFVFDYQKAHPETPIAIEEWPQPVCVQRLVAGDLDLAFLVNPAPEGRFESWPLAEDYMFAAIHRGHPLAADARPMPFGLLDGERIITGAPDNALKELFDRFCRIEGIEPRIIVSSSYSLNFVNSMTEPVGIATLTSAMAARVVNPAIVIRRLLTPEPGVMHCAVPLRSGRVKERSALVRYVRRYFETTPLPRFKED